jgi:hypothetical protein
MGARLLVLFEDPDGIRLEANFVPGGNTAFKVETVPERKAAPAPGFKRPYSG